MQFSLLIASLVAGAAVTMAVPAKRQFPVCTGTYSNAQCCATDVLNVADLNCANPPTTPTDGTDFKDICSAIGQQAKCCVLPILGQDLLCQDPVAAPATA